MHNQDPAVPRPCPFEKIYPSRLVVDDLFFMKLAYNQAIDAWRLDEVPVGAVIECSGEVIAATHNQVIRCGDPTAHAEILAITQAAAKIGDWRLNECRMYVTKEPCPMCAGASVMARLKEVVFATPDPRMGCLGGAVALHETPGFNHLLRVRGGVFSEACTEILQAFFRLKRHPELPAADIGGL